jgi:general secretion pathway protein D
VPAGTTPDGKTPPAQKHNDPPAGLGGAAPPPAAPAPSPAPSPPGRGSPGSLTLSVVVPAQAPRIGESLTVEIAASATGGVVDAPIHLVYDPAQLRFLEASEGDYMKQDGVATVFLVNGQSRPGDVLIGVGRTDRSRGAVGSGTLCRVRFEVRSAGAARLAIGSAMAWAVDGSLLPVTSSAAEIQILP